MPKDIKPFDKLSDEQKKMAIDIAIGMSIISARVPSFNADIFKLIANAWSIDSGVDPNVCRYALSGVSSTLYNTSWEFHVIKEGAEAHLTSQFIKRKEAGGGNGDAVQIE